MTADLRLNEPRYVKDVGTIVAINRDADAPICRMADLVLIADLKEAVPALIAALEARRDCAQVPIPPRGQSGRSSAARDTR